MKFVWEKSLKEEKQNNYVFNYNLFCFIGIEKILAICKLTQSNKGNNNKIKVSIWISTLTFSHKAVIFLNSDQTLYTYYYV